MKYLEIGKIGIISSGLLISRKEDKEKTLNENIKYSLLNLKSTIQPGIINLKELDVFNSKEIILDKYLTNIDDIIIRLGDPNYSMLITKKEEENILISSLFAKIRVDTSVVYPKYVIAYLNSSIKRSEMKSKVIGSSTQIINIQVIKDLKIEIPSMDKQISIGELYYNMQNKLLLMKQDLEESAKLYDGIINKIIANKEKR